MPNELRQIVQDLCAIKSRATSIKDVSAIFALFENHIEHGDVSIEFQPFKSPKHFIQILSWLFVGLILCLVIKNWFPLSALIIAAFLAVQAFMYFDWRSSLLTLFPPRVMTHNFIARSENVERSKKLILMAHWDTAPISLPYTASMIRNFRKNVWIGMIFILAVVVVCFLNTIDIGFGWLPMLTLFLILYFLVQIVVISVDFLRYGYSTGANDNATGCAVAIQIANQLWQDNHPDWNVELVITGAEEVGMLGAKAYLNQKLPSDTSDTFILNFDTLGCDHLQAITKSGTFTDIIYPESVIEIARTSAITSDIDVHFTEYRTADVDTAWFARKSIPSLSIISHNSDGVPSGIHRPEDQLENINWSTVENAAKYGLALAKQIQKEW